MSKVMQDLKACLVRDNNAVTLQETINMSQLARSGHRGMSPATLYGFLQGRGAHSGRFFLVFKSQSPGKPDPHFPTIMISDFTPEFVANVQQAPPEQAIQAISNLQMQTNNFLDSEVEVWDDCPDFYKQQGPMLQTKQGLIRGMGQQISGTMPEPRKPKSVLTPGGKPRKLGDRDLMSDPGLLCKHLHGAVDALTRMPPQELYRAMKSPLTAHPQSTTTMPAPKEELPAGTTV